MLRKKSQRSTNPVERGLDSMTQAQESLFRTIISSLLFALPVFCVQKQTVTVRLLTYPRSAIRSLIQLKVDRQKRKRSLGVHAWVHLLTSVLDIYATPSPARSHVTSNHCHYFFGSVPCSAFVHPSIVLALFFLYACDIYA
jgi:hypothetical protein